MQNEVVVAASGGLRDRLRAAAICPLDVVSTALPAQGSIMDVGRGIGALLMMLVFGRRPGTGDLCQSD